MNGIELGLGALEQDMWHVGFLMTRVGAAMLAAPFFGANSVPMPVRVSLTGALAIFISIWMPDIVTPPAIFTIDGMLAIAGEVVIGLALGFVLQIAFAAPTVAAEVISGAMGMSMAVSQDAMGGGTTTSFGQYFVIVLTLIFLATGAHLHWIALVTESYRAFPPGEAWLSADRLAAVASFGGFMLETAVRIALPVTLILFLVQVLTGFLSRSAPALNLFALGLPAGVLAGLAALIISAPLIFDQFTSLVGDALTQAESVILS